MLVRRFALATLALTFLLLLAGGLVSGTHSGLACPDWPTCYGSYFPPYEGGIEFEHTHRVIAFAVGLCTLVLLALLVRGAGASRRAMWGWVALFALPLGLRGTLTRLSDLAGKVYVLSLIAAFALLTGVLLAKAWRARAERPRALVLAGLGAGALVNVQGLLGGLTVLFELPPLVSIVHLGTAMGFFSLLVVVALLAHVRPENAAVWAVAPSPCREDAPLASGSGEPLPRWIAVGAALTFVQILLGAATRHLDAGLACGAEIPLCRGSLFPLEAHPVVLVHAAHRLHALLVAGVVVWLAVHVWRRARGQRLLRALAAAGPALVVVQITLGVMSVLTWLDLFWVTAHLGVGALLLADMVAMLVVGRRPAAYLPGALARGEVGGAPRAAEGAAMSVRPASEAIG